MPDRKNIRVLVAEDDYLVGEMIQGILAELDYTVVGVTTTGAQAVEKTALLRPNIVVMDIQMPEIDGIIAAHQIQQCCPTPIVILTAYETAELVEQASLAGVNAYLLKPPDSREMERAIAIALARFDDMLALRQLNTQLQAANEELDAFAHTVAHDLQSPLGLVIGFSEMLLHNWATFTEAKQQELLTAITRTAHKMSSIVNELLLLAGVRQMDFEPQPLSMTAVVHEAQQRLAEEIATANAEISLPSSWPEVLGHAPWVEEVWVNYLSNAIKYGGQPPCLELGAKSLADGMVRFWVRDNGPGLSSADKEWLFAPFTRLNQSDSRGHGLGLSIARRIVERLGGTVGAESTPGNGSTFWFTLPQVRA